MNDFISNEEKDKRVVELAIANEEKDRRVAELAIANEEKDKRTAELVIANEEKDKRAAELVIANEEKRAAELVIAKEQESIANDLTQLIDTANAPIFGIDAAGLVNEWNQRAELLTGFGKADVMGKDLVAGFITDDYKASVKAVLDKALKGEETANFEFPLFTKSGDRVDVLLNSTARLDAGGNIVGVVGVGQDVTRQRRQREELIKSRNETEFQSLHDPLTGLANRRGLDAAFKARKAYGITEGTLVHIDLDHFKNVNDNMGHAAGDFVLSEVAKILTSGVRSRNGDRLPDIAARRGGDEFVLLLGDSWPKFVNPCLLNLYYFRLVQVLVSQAHMTG
jgi:PAS domain S-box-containing protein